MIIATMLEDSNLSSDSTSRPMASRRKKQERQCAFCSQSFFKTEHLERHLRTHTREKPFKCDICKKSFTRHDTLLRHTRSHTENRRSSSATPISRQPALLADVNSVSPDAPSRSSFNVPAPPALSSDVTSNPGQNNSLLDPGQSSNTEALSFSLSETDRQSDSSGVQHQPVLDSTGIATQNILSTSPFSFTGDFGQGFTDANLWDIEYDTWPQLSWSVGSDFDLQAMNASIAASILQPGYQFQPPFNSYEQPELVNNTNIIHQDDREKTLEAVNRSWISRLEPSNVNGTLTPMNESDHHDRSDVDELYRSSLTRRLQPRPYDNSLPSTDFLNLCVSLYFSRFHALFPIVHAPTFRPSMTNSLLLISICSIGSLFIGSPSATAQGIQIFETLNKCILNSWERWISRSNEESLSMIQAAVIGQTFGLLSGIPNHPNLVDAFCGTVLSWARRGKMFKEKEAKPIEKTFHGDKEQLDKAWRSWIHSEQMIRIVLALHVHDAELAKMFHHEPLMRHEPERIPKASPERLFNASSAVLWATLSFQNTQKLQLNNPSLGVATTVTALGMTEYALLEGIGAAISEKRHQNQLDDVQQAAFVNDLIAWYTRTSSMKDQSTDIFCLMILWHATFIALFSDADLLERAIGRDGPAQSEEVKGQIIEWAASPSAKRCVIHASVLSSQLESTHVGSEPAIHVPQVLFCAAIVWYLYAHNAPADDTREGLDFPEIRQLGSGSFQHLFKTSQSRTGTPTVAESRKLYALRDMLQRVGHWGISRKFATILGILIDGDGVGGSGLG